MLKKRKCYHSLLKRLKEPRRFIQALIGPNKILLIGEQGIHLKKFLSNPPSILFDT